jgi:hypothetical protein
MLRAVASMAGRVTIVLKSGETLTYEDASADERDDTLVVRVRGRTVARFARDDVAHWSERPDV